MYCSVPSPKNSNVWTGVDNVSPTINIASQKSKTKVSLATELIQLFPRVCNSAEYSLVNRTNKSSMIDYPSTLLPENVNATTSDLMAS